ncbi:MAG: hypothetical protein ACTS22_02985 [Phycisphaerales bacterium]
MFLFVLYAVAVWFVAFRWRRRAAGLAAIGVAVGALALFNLVHYRVAAFFEYDRYIAAFRVIMYPYMAFVGGIGLYLFSFPRELRRGAVQCRACWYDLGALADEAGRVARCPECGATPAEARTRKGRRQARRRLRAHAAPVSSLLAPHHAHRHAKSEHAER